VPNPGKRKKRKKEKERNEKPILAVLILSTYVHAMCLSVIDAVRKRSEPVFFNQASRACNYAFVA
jgi:hypothetical protein